MALFTAETQGYSEALKLIKKLKENGIESSITSGGVSISVRPDQINTAKQVCKENKASFAAGHSRVEKDFLLGRDVEHLEQVTNDAISLIKEWDSE